MTSRIKELLSRYINDECSQEEAAELLRWYDTFKDHSEPYSAFDGETRDQLQYKLLQNIKSGIALKEGKRRRLIATGKILQYACSGAAAAVLLLAGILWLKTENKTRSGKQVPGEELIVSNQGHCIYKRQLPDGSVVWLSPDARITYMRKKETREVQMTGDVFFEIAPDQTSPFYVYSGRMLTRVLGTSFRIKTNSGDHTARIDVMSGKVAVSLLNNITATQMIRHPAAKEPLLLTASQAATLQDDQLDINDAGTSKEMAIWQKQKIHFDNASLQEVLKALNEKFGAHIVFGDDNLKVYRLNADFSGQHLPDILDMMKKSLNIRYEINGSEMKLLSQ
jgi:ferric-dicitrate binding protein FerR (iron transport regulator)